eukprot:tig00020830_g14427.t1
MGARGWRPGGACIAQSAAPLDEVKRIAGLLYWYKDAEHANPVHERACHETLALVAMMSAGGDRDALPAIERGFRRAIDAISSEYEDQVELRFDSDWKLSFAAFLTGRYLEAILLYRSAIDFIADRPEVMGGTAGDFFARMYFGLIAPQQPPPERVASGLRVAVALHRLVDWNGRTPVLAHLLFALGHSYAALGEAGKALAVFAEARAEYAKFPALFPPDHPRITALREAAESGSPAQPAYV